MTVLFDEDLPQAAAWVPEGAPALHVLIVEDQPPLRANLRQLLELEGFAVSEAADGRGALSWLAAAAQLPGRVPHLVLLDVGLPDLDGYGVCRHIRDDPALCHVPVIFLSGRVELVDRLAGYEAGAEDYIAKPYVNAELLGKIGVALRNGETRRAGQQLQGQVDTAMQAAFTAMTSASEIGVVLQLMKRVFVSPDNAALQQCVLQSLAELGLDVSVQLRSQRGSSTCNAEGPCGQLEIGLLDTLARRGTIVDAGAVTVFSYGDVSLAVKNMPREDEARNGRLRDNLAFLTEGVAARLAALDAAWQQQQQAVVLAGLVQRTRATLQVIDDRFRQQQWASNELMLRLRENVERAFVRLGLTEGQERMLAALLSEAAQEATALYDSGADVDDSMRALLAALDAGVSP